MSNTNSNVQRILTRVLKYSIPQISVEVASGGNVISGSDANATTKETKVGI